MSLMLRLLLPWAWLRVRSHILFLRLRIHDNGDVALDEGEGKEGDGAGSRITRGCLFGDTEEGQEAQVLCQAPSPLHLLPISLQTPGLALLSLGYFPFPS